MKIEDRLVLHCWSCNARSGHKLIYPTSNMQNSRVFDWQYKHPRLFTHNGQQIHVPAFRAHAIYACDVCSKQAYMLFEEVGNFVPLGRGHAYVSFVPPPNLRPGVRVVFQYPFPGSGSIHPDLPASISDSLQEAELCFGVRAYRACVVMVGRTLELVFEEQFPQDVGPRDMLDKILKQLRAEDKIREAVFDAAMQLKNVRNAGAHKGHDPIEEQDAKEMLEVLRMIVGQVYIEPAETARRLASLSKIK